MLQGHQGGGELVGIDVDRPPAQLLPDPRPQLDLEVGGVGVRVLEHGVHQRTERGACRELGHRGDGGRMRRLGIRGGVGQVGHVGQVGEVEEGLVGLVGQHRHRGLAADRGRLLLDPDQPGVGGTTPGGVDLAPEGAHPQLGLLAAARRGALVGRLDHVGGRPAELLEQPQDPLGVLVLARLLHVGHLGRAGLAAEEQSVQAAVAGVGRRRPPGDDLRLCAGEGDVEVAQLLARLLGPVQRLAARPLLALAADVKHPVAVLVVARDLGGEGELLEGEGEVGDGVLQPLRPVHRDDLDGGGVGVEPAGSLRGAARLLPQPAEDPGQAELLA